MNEHTDTFELTYMGRRRPKGKPGYLWLDQDGVVWRWPTSIQRRAAVGGRYIFRGTIDDDGKPTVVPSSGEYIDQHDDSAKWTAQQRADDQRAAADRAAKKNAEDTELDGAIEVLAARLAVLSGSQRAAWLLWVTTTATTRALKIAFSGKLNNGDER